MTRKISSEFLVIHYSRKQSDLIRCVSSQYPRVVLKMEMRQLQVIADLGEINVSQERIIRLSQRTLRKKGDIIVMVPLRFDTVISEPF